MKKNVLYLLLCVLMLSCNRSNFDLSTLHLPLADTSIVSKYNLKKEMEVKEFIAYSSANPDLLQLYGQSFPGSMGPGGDGESGFSNQVNFFLTPENNKISAYALRTETADKTAALNKLVNEKMGKTDYHYQSKEFTNQVWHKDGLYYFLSTNSTVEYYGKKTTTGDFTVVSEQCPVFLEWMTAGGGFSNYGEYLKAKNKPEHQGKNYSYKDFIAEEEKNDLLMGPSYLKDYVQ